MPCDNSKTSSDIEPVDWNSGQHYANVRFGSGSSQASQNSGDICRICHCESDPQNPLLTPCYCSGSLKYVHQACLQQWLTASETNSCELCKFPFIMHTKIKPFNEWRSLDISGIERRRLCCSVLFHCAAALCVIWSLCVLIERAADDVQRGLIDWPFWTKLAVVTVGLTGGIVFMYIQCKAYLHLCHRWKARNRILLIQNAPEKIHPIPPSPVAAHHQHFSEPLAHSGAASGAVEINVGAGPGGQDGGCSALDSGVGVGLQQQMQQRLLNASPHHMLQLAAELEMPHSSSSACTQTEDGHGHQRLQQMPQGGQQLGQVAVAANIECSQSQHNYDRDWALDDVVSQISSFRPCPQGSGSMTPFHDSIHNVLEHSEGSSRGSATDLCAGSRQDLSASGISTDTGREHALQLSSFSGDGEHKAPSISSGVSHAVANGLGGFVYKPHQSKRYSNSSIFLENRDVLSDQTSIDPETPMHPYDYSTPPKIDYRHSGMLSDDLPIGCCTADCLGGPPPKEELRRYSDPKLKPGEVDTVLDIDLPTSPLSPPAAYASRESYSHPHSQAIHRSFDRVDGVTSRRPSEAQVDRSRLSFKSLPNLSSSCESLLQK
ncbi:hypothetical protein KR074_012000 [Drosophila pseudoananassae]|nr:hypothetical protein KR074_012000 [Drosophila pseudoananassae]